jgi:hypothetical protein
VQIETPKKCTTTVTVYVGSECDASMPNGTQARENHVGSSDRQADNTFISGEDENFTVNGNGSTTGIYEAKLTQDKPSAATLMELSERVSTGDTTIIVSVAVVKYGLPSAKAFANVL